MSNDVYSNYYKAKLEGALQYQDFIVDLFFQALGLPIVQYASKAYQLAVGESRACVEIKHDEMFARTGNLWIEVAEKSKPRKGDYYPSGIRRNDNAIWYVQGDYNKVFLFGKNLLNMLADSGRYPIRANNTETSLGFLFCESDAEKYADSVLTPNAATKVMKITKDAKRIGQILHQAAKENPAQATLFPLAEWESEGKPS